VAVVVAVAEEVVAVEEVAGVAARFRLTQMRDENHD
jgi:hypothetical protein